MNNICIKYEKVGCYLLVTEGDKFYSVSLKEASISGSNNTVVVNDRYGNSAILTPKILKDLGFTGDTKKIILSWLTECHDNKAMTTTSHQHKDICYYEKVLIWAEEYGALQNNQNEWSFGNGGTGGKGIPIPEADWEIYAFSLQADSSSNGASATIDIINRTDNTVMATMPTASGATNNLNFTTILPSPVPINVGDSIGFRTQTVVGRVSDVIVSVWLRRKVCIDTSRAK